MNKFTLFLKTSLVDPFIRSFQRFTDSIVLSILLVILGIVNLEVAPAFFLTEMLPFLWLTLPLLVFKTLLIERLNMKSFWKYVLAGGALLITVSFYLFMRYVFVATPSFNSFRLAIGWILALIAALLVNYFPKKDNFAYYLVYLLTKFFVTVFYSAVLYGGLFAIFSSIDLLFGANIGSHIYIDLLIAVLGLVAVPVLIGYIPKVDEEMTDNNYHKIWRTVFAFIIVPLIMIFSAILIVYILTSFANNNYYGIVYLISALATVFLTLAMIFLLENFEADYPHVRFFNKYWPFVLIVILGGFFYELTLALIDQGFILATGIYFYAGLALTALLVVRFIKKPLRLGQGQIFGVTSAATAFVMAFVPFINILSLAVYSINARFESLLTNLGMLENGEIVHSPDELTLEERQLVSSYVISFIEVGFERIRCLPEGFVMDDFYDVFGFVFSEYQDTNRIHLFYESTDEVVDLQAMGASSYTDFIYVPYVMETADFGIYHTDYNMDTGVWVLSKNDVAYLTIDMTEIIEAFHVKFVTNTDFTLDLYTDLKYTPVSDDYDIYFKSISGGYTPSEATYVFHGAEFYLGVK